MSSLERKSFASLLIVFGNLTSSIRISSNRMSWSLQQYVINSMRMRTDNDEDNDDDDEDDDDDDNEDDWLMKSLPVVEREPPHHHLIHDHPHPPPDKEEDENTQTPEYENNNDENLGTPNLQRLNFEIRVSTVQWTSQIYLHIESSVLVMI